MDNSVKAASCLPELVQKDKKGLWIFGESESKRRVIIIEKKNGSYGFTLQSYGVRYKHGNRETDFITYVNAVEKDGAAFHAGLREGDVILSINGQNMARVEHKSLVNFIRKCPTHLKMVVVSDERARKVELHMRYVHLQKKLHDKMKELEQLNWKEKEILTGTYRNPCGSPLGAPCLSAATSACCFCPPKSKQSGGGGVVGLDEKEKSKTISAIGVTDTKDKERFFYDCYRKSQSNRELHHRSDSMKRQNSSGNNNNNNNSSNSIGGVTTITTTVTMTSLNTPSKSKGGEKPPGSGNSGATNLGNGNNGSSSAAATTSATAASYKASTPSSSSSVPCDPQLKPKSWDNLMTTKSFGGYGFGFGYGYFPQKQHSHGNYNTHHVTHPHHHNHHSHCSHSHSNYYYSKQGTSASSRSQQQEQAGGQPGTSTYAEHRHCPPGYPAGPYQIITTGKTIRPGDSNPGNSKTLPVMRTAGSSRTTPESFGKMEKTLSDSSLNSEHHKDFPKNMSYLSRSKENIRYSSDEDYDEYRTEKVPHSQHDIFV